MAKTTKPIESLEVVKAEVASNPFTIITVNVVDANSLAKADSLLFKVGERRKWLKQRIDAILKPLNEVRNAILALKRDEDEPLEKMELSLRAGMAAYKDSERRRELTESRDRVEKEEKLRKDAEAKTRAAELAKAGPIKARLETAARNLEQAADDVAAAPLPSPVRVEHSTTRIVTKWRCTDLAAFIKAVAAGDVPEEALEVSKLMDGWVRSVPSEVKRWPGIEIYEESIIVRR